MRKPFEIPYMEIIKDSFRLAWKRRYLWWFGLFVSLTSGGGMNYYHSFSSSSKNGQTAFPKDQIISFISSNLGWIIAIGILIILLSVVLAVLATLGRGALIGSIQKEISGKAAAFKSGMAEGKNNFWKIISISISAGLFIFSALLLIISPIIFLFYIKSYIAGALMALLGLLILIPLIILAGYIQTYAYLYAVIFRLGFRSSIEKAYCLFQKNIGASLIMGLLFVVLNFMAGIATLIAVAPVAIVFFAFGLLFYFIAGKAGAIIIAALGALVIVIALITIRAIYEVFSQAAWIKFFHVIGEVPEEELATEPKISPLPEKPMPIIEMEIK